MKRQTIAPRYHLKAKLLDGLAVALLMAITAALGCAVLILSSPQAKADVSDASFAYAAVFGDAVCSTLDRWPSFDGILGIGQAIVKDGLTIAQAGEVIELSVHEICPRHLGLMDRFIATYAPSAANA
jgi:hypothetical protein